MNRLGRFARGVRPEDNPLLEQPRPDASSPPPPPPRARASTELATVAEKPQSIFDRAKQAPPPEPHTRWGTQEFVTHDAQTRHFKISPRKLNKLANQIGGGTPIDWAILQMGFSEKRAGKKVRDLLLEARDDAQRLKGLRRDRLVVAEAWVGKAYVEKRPEFKGRSKVGIREHRYTRLYVRLREGKTPEQRAEERMQKALKRVKGPGYTREDVPLRNVRPMWTW
ncbi:ribosomal protein L22 [Auricularia subglabra TFB-10046 SS5]|nr:ribosomal protein L22 [Auricularia subglabra TFB-10046 SS5]